MLCRMCGLLIVLFLSTASSMCVANDDTVKLKLDKAKAAYDLTMDKFRTAVGEYFDKREDAARKDGSKKLVDQIKAERQAFKEKDELPNSAPAALKQKAAAAKTSMENAYLLAVKEYTKAKLDDKASAMESELVAFRRGLPASETRERWVHDEGEYRMIGEGTWEEKSPNGNTYRYKETSRTKEYVQIDAVTGNTNISIRLYDTKVEYATKPKMSYTARFTGRWAK